MNDYKEVYNWNCKDIWKIEVKNGDEWRVTGKYGTRLYDYGGLNKQKVIQKYILDNR